MRHTHSPSFDLFLFHSFRDNVDTTSSIGDLKIKIKDFLQAMTRDVSIYTLYVLATVQPH